MVESCSFQQWNLVDLAVIAYPIHIEQVFLPLHSWTPRESINLFQVGMCIMEHLEVPESSANFISNPEYRILFRNNLLGAKYADRAEV